MKLEKIGKGPLLPGSSSCSCSYSRRSRSFVWDDEGYDGDDANDAAANPSSEMMLQQQQQQTQLLQQFMTVPRAEAPMAQQRIDPGRPIQLPEFRRLVDEFVGDKSDPTVAEGCIEELEKAFSACEIPKDRKLSLAVFLLKRDANSWWRQTSVGMDHPTWPAFRDAFFQEYFPNATREQMTSDWLNLRQGSKSVDECEAEFNRLLRFTSEGYRENKK